MIDICLHVHNVHMISGWRLSNPDDRCGVRYVGKDAIFHSRKYRLRLKVALALFLMAHRVIVY